MAMPQSFIHDIAPRSRVETRALELAANLLARFGEYMLDLLEPRLGEADLAATAPLVPERPQDVSPAQKY